MNEKNINLVGKPKEFVAVFKRDDGRTKTVRFGTSSNFVLNKQKTEADRQAYIARHRVNENWNAPDNAGALSRFLLWETRSLQTNIRRFKKKFNV
jgi:hypothetical protein